MGMLVSINQNFDVRVGVVNGSWGFLWRVQYQTDEDEKRYLTSSVVEVVGSNPVDIAQLPKHHFPVLPDVMEITYEHSASHWRCMIKRKQVPMEPGFAITAHKAQGKTMDKVVVDLAGCSGTEQPYVMVSRCTLLEGLVILQNFDIKKITCWQSEDLQKEVDRLELLRLQTVVKHGAAGEVVQAKCRLGMLKVGGEVESRKRSIDDGDRQGKRVELTVK